MRMEWLLMLLHRGKRLAEVARVVQMNSMLGHDTKQSTSIVTIQKSLSLTALVVLNGVAVATLSSHIDFKAGFYKNNFIPYPWCFNCFLYFYAVFYRPIKCLGTK